jgi:hypothetical protein
MITLNNKAPKEGWERPVFVVACILFIWVWVMLTKIV